MNPAIEHQHVAKYRVNPNKVKELLDLITEHSTGYDPNKVIAVHIEAGIVTITTMDVVT